MNAASTDNRAHWVKQIARYLVRQLLQGLLLSAPLVLALGGGFGGLWLVATIGRWVEHAPVVGAWLASLGAPIPATGFLSLAMSGLKLLVYFWGLVTGMQLGFEWSAAAILALLALVED